MNAYYPICRQLFNNYLIQKARLSYKDNEHSIKSMKAPLKVLPERNLAATLAHHEDDLPTELSTCKPWRTARCISGQPWVTLQASDCSGLSLLLLRSLLHPTGWKAGKGEKLSVSWGQTLEACTDPLFGTDFSVPCQALGNISVPACARPAPGWTPGS